jgi:hypothetical protein
MRATALALKPQDIVVALALTMTPSWTYPGIAAALGMSASEVHGAVKRLHVARLYNEALRAPRAHNLFELLVHGVKYVFPAEPGPMRRGVATAASAPPLRERFVATPGPLGEFVWPDPNGADAGHAVQPLYPTVPEAARRDPALHELLALVDALRIGRARERAAAEEELRRRLLGDRHEAVAGP